ncbi:MAG: hypothetical protein ABIN01_09600 [Ferruginibacter sp.]
MTSAICTLFEGHYHYGIAALTNSLYKEGYRGSIYAGYRGPLPRWADLAEEDPSLKWKNGKTLRVADGLQLHFLPLETDYHLTNYKPDFMLELWNGPASPAQRMFYFDPDIVIVCSWLIFEEWVSCGVALSEDVNSPLSKHHPRRVAWRQYFGEKGIPLNFKENIYVNGGFVGVNLENKSFLELWKKIQITMAPLIGGLNSSIFGNFNLLEAAGGPFMPFYKTDQDALNASIEAGSHPVSFMGKEGMGFENGFVLMHHALGTPKPWKWKPYRQSLGGWPPRKVDLEYWKVAGGPIKATPVNVVRWRRVAMKITTAIGRFYKKN